MTIVPDYPTDTEIRNAFAELWRAYKDFPFDGACSRGVMLAAALTPACRPNIDTAPGFAFDAPRAASGKTELAKCIAYAAGAACPPIEAPPPTNEEAGKRLHAALRIGAPVIIWDNVIEPIRGNSAVCSFLTAPYFSGRVLGLTQMESYPNRAMFLLTGNNLKIEGDACRRILKCRIDAQVERPGLRSFDLTPASYVRDNRRAIRVAALTIMRGFFARGAPKQTSDTAGSFETWDRMVRQCVIWLARSGLASVALDDPYLSALDNMDADPQEETVLDVMRAWRATFGGAWKASGEALSALDVGDWPKVSVLRAIGEGLTPRRFAGWLQRHRDEIIDGLRIVARLDSDSKNWRYAVLPVERESSALDPEFLASLAPETQAAIKHDPTLADLL